MSATNATQQRGVIHAFLLAFSYAIDLFQMLLYTNTDVKSVRSQRGCVCVLLQAASFDGHYIAMRCFGLNKRNGLDTSPQTHHQGQLCMLLLVYLHRKVWDKFWIIWKHSFA